MVVPAKLFTAYLLILLIGCTLLLLPFSTSMPMHIIDNIFTATSALSTTGLGTVDIGNHYSGFGQIVILLLIQVGGIGYMTVGTMFAMSLHHRFSRDEHDLIRGDLNLPENFSFAHLVKVKIVLTLTVETIGAIFLYLSFVRHNVDNAIWQAIFHSVSAFCTAGMSLFPHNLESFQNDYLVQFTIILLCLIGSFGFIVFTDLYYMLRDKRRRLSVTSKVILRMFFLVVTVGTTVLYFMEDAIPKHSVLDTFAISLFHCLSALTTAGFDTLDMNTFSPASLFLICLLMFVGSSPTGTGGGLKSTTVAILFKKMISTFMEKNTVVLLRIKIPDQRVDQAMSSVAFYFTIFYIAIFALLYTEDQPFIGLFFEAASAIGTVGLSTGITSILSDTGKCILILLMFIGRITPLAVGIILFNKFHDPKAIKKEDISI